MKDSWGWGQGQGSAGMVWAWGRVPGDRLWGGVQFCWQVGHLLFLATVVWASVAEVHWGLGLAATSSDILKTIELRPTILYLSRSIEGVIEYVLITVSALSTSPSLPNLFQIHFPSICLQKRAGPQETTTIIQAVQYCDECTLKIASKVMLELEP